MTVLTPAMKSLFIRYLKKYKEETSKNIAKKIWNDKSVRSIIKNITSFNGFYVTFSMFRKNNPRLHQIKSVEGEQVIKEDKKGLELRKGYVINWSTKTIITDLGEYGTFVCSFDMHKAVQRNYVWQGGGDTAAIVAMKFDFSHAKAVHKYAKIHGFTKSSLPQTDIEFESGLTVEEAVEENLQTLKRQAYKQTERVKWQFVQTNSDKWLDFSNSVVKPLENLIEANLPSYKPLRIDVKGKISNDKFAGVLGISDWHFMKLCYGPNGEYNYNKEIARQKIKDHSEILIKQMLMYGKPEKIFLPVGGNDNIHIDGPEHETTAGTRQINATDGIWRIGMSEYLDIVIDYIESVAQVCDVELVCFPGNHDEKTSILMSMFLTKFYSNDKRINVHNSLHPRLYYQYGGNCLIFTHGHHLGNKKLRNEIHKIILGEAKHNGMDLNKINNFLLFTGHDHVGSFQDLNGNVQHFIMPSLAGTDDFWHLGQGYMGRAMESAGYIVDPIRGRKAIVYS